MIPIQRLFASSILLFILGIGVCCSRKSSPSVTASDGAADNLEVSPSVIEVYADPATGTTVPATTSTDPIVRIRDEGLNRSQVMKTLSYLTDVIGPRLTGSPNLRRANQWTRQQL